MIATWWKVFINGIELPVEERQDITSLKISNPLNGSDTLTLDLADPEMKHIDDNLYLQDVPVRAEFGIFDTLFMYVFNGYISAIDIDLPESGTPTLKITCLDETHRMNREKKKRSWEKTTSARVVQAIAKEYGFDCEIESGYTFKQEDTISQSNETDIKFLESLADKEDEKFYCKLIGNTIHYKKMQMIGDSKVNLTYRKYPNDLLGFSPKINTETVQVEASSSDINTDKLTKVSSTVNENNASYDRQGSQSPTETSSTQSTQQSGKTYDPKTRKWVDM